MDNEQIGLLGALISGALLQAALRNKVVSTLVPALAVFLWLGFLEVRRPYTGGGASFYILIQIAISFASAFTAACGMLLIEKCFPTRR